MAPDSRIGDERLQTAIAERFACLRCGHCCKGDGIVRFGPLEAEAMAAALALPRQKFLKIYALQWDSPQWILRDRFVCGAGILPAPPPQGGTTNSEQWCVFLERAPDGRHACRLGDAKPRQCKAFPLDWLNPDSLETCAGLRRLKAELK